jgi:hypothetical protein
MISDEILSSPPILSFSTFKPGFSKYMQFTYNSNIDNSNGQTEYTITLNDDYKYIVDILVVGGGGGGGNSSNLSPAGGGSAGGIVYIVNKKLEAGTYKIIVGNGGSESMITYQNNNVILDGIPLKAYGGESGFSGVNNGSQKIGGNGGGVGIITADIKATFWNGESYVPTVFKGANGGVNFSGGGGGSLSEGKDIQGGDGRSIDITGNYQLYGCGGCGAKVIYDSNDNIVSFESGISFDYPGSGGSYSIFSGSNNSGSPGIVIISYRSEKKILNNNKQLFCKVEDSNKNKYILTDKYKQPLQCYNDKCIIFNEKKALEDLTFFNSNANLDKLFIDTKIQCKAIRDSSGNIVDSEPINKSNINFDNYNIASINKNKIISNNYKLLTAEEIENNFNSIYLNGNELELMELMIYNDIGPKIYNLKHEYDYLGPKSDLLIQEDITKINPKPKPSKNNNIFIYIYICIGIALFFLFIFVIYNKYIKNINSDASTTNNHSFKSKKKKK